MTPAPQFGISIDPSTRHLEAAFAEAALADRHAYDLITIQDHPYNRRFLETWTLMTALAVRTERARFTTNVANLPLRPPAMLAKMAATLDVITGGRVELGLGAGAFWQPIAAYGGPTREPGIAYRAFEDALHILRGMWDNAGRSFTYEGSVYRVKGAQPGPAPAHRIPIWVGATGPRMLRLTGRMADGILVSSSYMPPARLDAVNRLIDEGAAQAGRSPDAIRRGYNLMGTIVLSPSQTKDGQGIYGTAREWADYLTRLHAEHQQDTFIFWPAGDNRQTQFEAFAEEVIPAVKAAAARATV